MPIEKPVRLISSGAATDIHLCRRLTVEVLAKGRLVNFNIRQSPNAALDREMCRYALSWLAVRRRLTA